MKTVKISVIGVGFVGGAVRDYFLKQYYPPSKRNIDLFLYDPQKDYNDDYMEGDIIFVCVPTPSMPDGSCNSSIVEDVVREIDARCKTKGTSRIVIIKSTILPGTTKKFREIYKNCIFVFNPEFLTEANAFEDFCSPDRQVIGYRGDNIVTQVLFDLLPSSKEEYNEYIVGSTEAEMGKYASNVFGALKVAFANIIYDYCEAVRVKIDVKCNYERVKEIVQSDSRIGPSWMKTPCNGYRGFSGHCFPKDLSAFIQLGESMLDSDEEGKTYYNRLLERAVNVLKAIKEYNDLLIEMTKKESYD